MNPKLRNTLQNNFQVVTIWKNINELTSTRFQICDSSKLLYITIRFPTSFFFSLRIYKENYKKKRVVDQRKVENYRLMREGWKRLKKMRDLENLRYNIFLKVEFKICYYFYIYYSKKAKNKLSFLKQRNFIIDIHLQNFKYRNFINFTAASVKTKRKNYTIM